MGFHSGRYRDGNLQELAMKPQQGSILVGVIALSLFMTMAAAGFIALAGSSSNEETNFWNDMRRFRVAESGLLMGVRWLRENTDAQVTAIPDDGVFRRITPGTGWREMSESGYSAGSDGELFFQVEIAKNGGNITLRSEARLPGTPPDKLRLEWTTTSIDGGHAAPLRQNLVMANWTETRLPYP